MPFPSFFKPSRHKRFSYQPRYYKAGKGSLSTLQSSTQQRLRMQFKRKRLSTSLEKSSLLRFILVLLLIGLAVGYFFVGEWALLGGFLLAVFLFWLWLRKTKRRL